MTGCKDAAQRRLPLPGNLWRIGVWTSSLRGVNVVRAALALLGLSSVALGLAAGVLANAFHDHRAEVARARTPVFAGADSDRAEVRWRILTTAVDGRAVGLYAIEPHADDAPLPPGVERWPRPGEAVLSPALLELLQEHGVDDRFGRVVSVIGPEGLASRTELLAYTRLGSSLDPGSASAVTGFGVDGEGPVLPTGELLYDRSVVELWSLGLVLLVLPGVIALGSAARVATTETRRRHVLLARLGAPRRARAIVALPPVLLPCIVSLAACLALVGVACEVDLVIPLKGNVLDAAVIRGALLPVLTTIVGTHIVAAATLAAVAAGRLGQLGAARLVAPRDRPARARTIVLLAVLAAQPVVVSQTTSSTIRSLSTLVAAIVAVVCMPAALATGMRAAGAWRARRALAAGRVGAFLGWRSTHHRSWALARLTGSICGLVVVVGHAAAVLAMFTGPALQARQIGERIGTSLLVAHAAAAGVPAHDIVAFARDRALAVVGVRASPDQERAVLYGTCGDLEVLGLACRTGPAVTREGSARFAAVAGWYGRLGGSSGAIDVSVIDGGAVDTGSSDALLLSGDGGDLDALALSRDAHDAGMPLSIEPLGASWLVGATDLLHKSYWVFVFGVPGVLTLLLVGALTWAAVVVEEGKALVRNPLLVDRQDVFTALAAIRVGLPIAVGGLAGAVATAWLLAPHERIGAADVPVILGDRFARVRGGRCRRVVDRAPAPARRLRATVGRSADGGRLATVGLSAARRPW
jgi:hypothetical protein